MSLETCRKSLQGFPCHRGATGTAQDVRHVDWGGGGAQQQLHLLLVEVEALDAELHVPVRLDVGRQQPGPLGRVHHLARHEPRAVRGVDDLAGDEDGAGLCLHDLARHELHPVVGLDDLAGDEHAAGLGLDHLARHELRPVRSVHHLAGDELFSLWSFYNLTRHEFGSIFSFNHLARNKYLFTRLIKHNFPGDECLDAIDLHDLSRDKHWPILVMFHPTFHNFCSLKIVWNLAIRKEFHAIFSLDHDPRTCPVFLEYH